MKSRFLKLISVLCLVAMLVSTCAISVFAEEASDWSSTKKGTIPEYAYSFAVVGDTQVLTIDETKKDDTRLDGNMDKLYDWILNNQKDKNIKFAFHMGDVTDNSTTDEWKLAKKNLSKLGDKIPNNVARGNHDSANSMVANYTTQMFETGVIPGEEFGYFDGRGISNYTPNTLNTYQTITVGDVMYLMLALDLGPCTAVIEWANEVIEAHPYHNVIISTHSYLQGDYSNTNYPGAGTYMDAPKDCSATQYNPGGYYGLGGDYGVDWDFRLDSHKNAGEAYRYQDASYMLNNLVKKHKNISMVLCGHECSEYVKQISATGDNSNNILQFLVDGQLVDRQLQEAGDGHAGLVGMFYFSADGKKVTTEYYSTTRNQYLHDVENTKTYDVSVVTVPQAVKDFYKVMHSISENDYCEADWKAISSTLNTTKQTIITSTDEAELTAAAAKLASAVNGRTKLNRTALNEALAAAEGKVEKENTTETWKIFASALNSANLAKKSKNQNTINKAASDLAQAIEGLKAPDLTALNAAIEAAKKLEGQKDMYDAKKWETFEGALAKAEKYKTSRSQKTLDGNAKSLIAAMEALELKGDSVPTVGTDESQTNTEEKSGCGSVIAASSVVLATVLALGFGIKKKED